MKGLNKSISKLAIASLICMNGAMAAESAPQSTKKNQPLKATTKPSVQKSKVIAAPVKKLEDRSVNQAQYLRVKPQANSNQSIFLAQESVSNSLRQDLKIEPFSAGSAPTYSPTLSFGIPSAFGATWGDAFVVLSGATAGKARDGQIDGSITAGFGLGSSDTIGLEVSYNLGSIKNFGANGTFDLKAHRIIYADETNQVAIAAGWETFAQYGNEGVAPSGIYGAITSYSLLQPNDTYNKMPISFTVGVGGGGFRQGNSSTGIFGGVGLQVHPQIGIGASWSGVGINAGVSYVPDTTIPLTIGVTGADLTNNSRGGTVLVLNVSYGFNFLPK